MLSSLCKQKSWFPDSTCEEAWIRRGSRFTGRRGSSGGSLSFTDDDLDELRACIELGFGFDTPEIEINDRLTSTLPALGFYRAIVGQNYDGLLGRISVDSGKSSICSTPSKGEFPLSGGQAGLHFPGEDPQEVKTRLRQVGTGGVFVRCSAAAVGQRFDLNPTMVKIINTLSPPDWLTGRLILNRVGHGASCRPFHSVTCLSNP